jgi:hypothetical protein
LLKNLAYFNIGFKVFGVKFQYFLKQIDTVVGLAQPTLNLGKDSHCLEAIFISGIACDCLETSLSRLVIVIVEKHLTEIKLR